MQLAPDRAGGRHCRPRRRRGWVSGALALLATAVAWPDVLPEDRADVLFHRYSGGGITVEGPSVLVRKKLGDNVSVSANYYVDMISSASIDVITQASPYKETRHQYSAGADILQGNTTYSTGYISSRENDYLAKTAFLNISQSMFGDLTTLSFGYTQGWDVVGRRGDPTFREPLDRRNWTLGLSQVLTRKLLLGLNLEVNESEGFENNPYREVRYLDPLSSTGYSRQLERYPHTRTGNAAAFELKYYLPWRASLDGSFRWYADTWGIRAKTERIALVQPWHQWTFDTHLRFYQQTRADFYSDLFPYFNAQNFLARDRELATFNEVSAGLLATWELPLSHVRFIQKGTANLGWDYLRFNYKDFRDLRVHVLIPGTEPLYVLDASVLQFFISFWF